MSANDEELAKAAPPKGLFAALAQVKARPTGPIKIKSTGRNSDRTYRFQAPSEANANVFGSNMTLYEQVPEIIFTMKKLLPVVEMHFNFGTNGLSINTNTMDGRFVDFCRASKSVKIVVRGKPQESAKFSGEEVLLICGAAWPIPEIVDNIQRSVSERKAYPLPEPDIPGGGGKSAGAAGQTRKPGSHRDNRGHN